MVVAIVPSSLVAQRCTQIKGLEKSYPSLFRLAEIKFQAAEKTRGKERERLILSVARRTRSEWENERKSRGRLFRLFEDARSGRGWVGNGEDLSNRVAWRVYILRGCVPGAYATSPPKARRCNDAGHYY